MGFYMIYDMNDPPPIEIWDIWEVSFATSEEVESGGPTLNERIFLRGYVGEPGRKAALAQAKALRDGCNGIRGYAVRHQGYDPVLSVGTPEYYDSGFYPHPDEPGFDDFLSDLEARPETDDPYLEDFDDWPPSQRHDPRVSERRSMTYLMEAIKASPLREALITGYLGPQYKVREEENGQYLVTELSPEDGATRMWHADRLLDIAILVAAYNLTECDLFGDRWLATQPDYDPFQGFGSQVYDTEYIEYQDEEDDSNPLGEISGGQFQQPKQYTRGDRICHPTFGEGVVLKSDLEGQNELIDVQFQEQYGEKRLNVRYAKLIRLSKIPLTLDSI